jgi:acyl transferase domain-containing protein
VQIQLFVDAPEGEARRRMTLYSRTEGSEAPWTRHAIGTLDTADLAAPPHAASGAANSASVTRGTENADFAVWPPPQATALPFAEFYAHLAELGLEYGATFQGLRGLWRDGATICVEVDLVGLESTAKGDFGVHPALLDVALRATMIAADEAGPEVHQPVAWSGVRLARSGTRTLRVRVARSPAATGTDPASPTITFLGCDAAGEEVLRGEVRSGPIPREVVRDAAHRAIRDLYRIEWLAVTLPPHPTAEPGAVVVGSATWAQALGVRAVPDLAAVEALLDA